MSKVHVKVGDTVILRVGDYNDKFEKEGKRRTGKVLAVSPKEGKVIVEGINKVKKHVKPRKQGDPSGIMKQETPIRACKVMRVCPKCDKPTRVKHQILASGEKVRVCTKCGETI